MTTTPTPDRYDVADYTSKTDPRRMATIRDVVTANILTVTTEDEARNLIAKLTAWLDAPRLAARKTPTVVAERDGIRLLTTSDGEWGIADADDESPGWLSCEDDARCEFRGATGTVSCESCARFIDHDDAECDDDGIYTCADETACSASCAAKESAK